MKDEISAKELSALLLVSERQIQKLAKEGVITKSGHGRYSFWEVIPQYVTHIQKHQPKEKLNLTDEQARKTRAEADIKEIELAQRRSEVIPVYLVEKMTVDMFTQVKTLIRGLPARAANRLLGETDKKVFKEKMADEIDSCLTAIPEQVKWEDKADG